MSATMDDTVPSIRAQIEALDIGETYSRAQRYDADDTPKAVPVMALRSVRMGVQRTVYDLEARTGRKFTIESGEFRTKSRDIMIVLCVTRVE